jgi:thioredoxin 1
MKITIMEFWAPWCHECKRMDPILDELEKDYNVRRINVDKNSSMATLYGIMTLPSILIFQDGLPMRQLTGVKTKEEIEKAIHSI